MKNKFKKLLIGGIAISFFLSVPNVLTKIKTENSSKTVEISADYRHIYTSASVSGEVTEKNIMTSLKQNGVTSIALNENSLKELESRELVHVYKGSEFGKIFWNSSFNFSIERNHTYVVVPLVNNQKEITKTIIESQIGEVIVHQAEGKSIMEIGESYASVYTKPLLFLESDYEKLAKDFFINPRVSNGWEERLPLLINQLSRWEKQKEVSSVIFEGGTVEGFDEEENRTNINPFWNEIGIGYIEFFSASQKQKGINDYITSSGYNISRVHSIPREKLEKNTDNELKQLVVKAIKERNIRTIYVNVPFYKMDEEPKVYLEETGAKLAAIQKAVIENGMKTGQSEPFTEKKNELLTNIGVFGAMFGSMLLFLLALLTFVESRTDKIPVKLFVLAIVSGGLLIMTGFGGNGVKTLISLGLSILLPVWAAFYLMKTLDSFEITQSVIFKRIIAPLMILYVVGISFLTSVNHGIEKVIYAEGFRGVSLTLILPPLLVAFLLYFVMEHKMSLKKIFGHRLRIIDICLIGLIGAFFIFYESRSGNAGTLLPFEANIRNWLENTLPVRPRTKELLFAFPLLAVMIGFWKESKWVRILMPLVVIGFASVFNTFTHFHTPIEYSTVRTVLSVLMGTVFGLILLLFLKPIVAEVKRMFVLIKK